MSERQLLASIACSASTLAGGSPFAGSSLVQQGAGAPPADGSWTKPIWKDTTTGFHYVNLGTVAAPDPEII